MNPQTHRIKPISSLARPAALPCHVLVASLQLVPFCAFQPYRSIFSSRSDSLTPTILHRDLNFCLSVLLIPVSQCRRAVNTDMAVARIAVGLFTALALAALAASHRRRSPMPASALPRRGHSCESRAGCSSHCCLAARAAIVPAPAAPRAALASGRPAHTQEAAGQARPQGSSLLHTLLAGEGCINQFSCPAARLLGPRPLTHSDTISAERRLGSTL